MAFDFRIVLQKAAQVIETRLKLQVPQPGYRSGDQSTGALKRSIKVQVVNDSILVSYNEYGKYTNFGTRNYFRGTDIEPGRFRGYSKGRNGIKPQYWSSISQRDWENILEMIDQEIIRQINIALNR